MTDADSDVADLRRRLAAAEGTLEAIQRGEIDGLVVTTAQGPRVYTLQGADEFYRTLIEQMGEGAAAVRPDGLLVYANESLARMVGQPLEVVTGSPVKDIVEPRDHERLQRLLAPDDDTAEAHLRLRVTGTDDRRHVRVTARAIVSDDGQATTCLIVSDRTATIEAERIRRDAEVVTDRERVARDLHDTVIQGLFATGLRLDRIRERVDPETAGQIEATVVSIDGIIHELRQAIFDLRPPTMIADISESIVRITAAAEHNLGFAADLTMTGDFARVPAGAVGDLLASLRESLSNAARHAQAMAVRVDVTVADNHLTLTVDDDGRGIDPGRTHSGLQNLRVRAEAHNGGFTAQRGHDGSGTTVSWRIPLERP